MIHYGKNKSKNLISSKSFKNDNNSNDLFLNKMNE
jgi:hypothetical protein